MLRLMTRLSVKRATLHELAAEFRVTTRTIRRDLEALSLAGVQVRKTTEFNGFWFIAEAR